MAPAQYRRTSEVARPRVAYIQGGDADAPYEPEWPAHRRRRHRRARRVAPILMAMSVVSAAIGGVLAVHASGQPTRAPVALDAAIERTTGPASRAEVRSTRVPVKPSRSATTSPAPKVSKSKAPPRPVTGLSQAQMNNAAVIVQVGQKRGVPRRAMLVAMMTGLQESSLRNLANTTVPASLDEPNEGHGENFDSLGVFQQRPSQGWGTVAELMTPRYAADAFYERLLKVADWETKSLGDAAQAVQRSGVPDAYAEHEERAGKVLDALL